MSGIDFNSKVPSSDATESAAERDRAEEKKTANKTAAFQNAMQRAGTPGSPANAATPAPLNAAQAAQKQATTQTQTGDVKQPQTAQAQTQAQAPAQAQPQSQSPTKPGTAPAEGGNASSIAGASATTPATTPGTPGAASGTTGTIPGAAPGTTPQTQPQTGGGGGHSGQQQNESSPSSQKLEAAIRDQQDKMDAATTRRDKPTSRIDLNAIVPSFPMPAQPPPAVAGPPPLRPAINAQVIEQIVQYAMVTQNQEGQAEFHLGLSGATLGGIGVHLTACGRRRVRIRFTGVGDDSALGENEISKLVESLRQRNVEVADVEVE